MNEEIKALAETVQYNCHIADARYAGDYTLCVYLLKMREMYRWEQGESFNTTLTTDDVGDWLTEREGQWDDVEESEYKALTIDGVDYDPFDNEAINILLETKGVVYNAGLGIRCRPHFFLAELEQQIDNEQQSILISGKEYARDMAAPPAMAQENHIYIRRESLRRLLWEKVEEWRLSGLDSPIGRAAACYGFTAKVGADKDSEEENNEVEREEKRNEIEKNVEQDVESGLDQMVATEIDNIIAHEKGEVKAGLILGDAWLDMLSKLPKTHAEIMLRAVRDHLADAYTTLPLLLKVRNPASIHFYFGNMTAMRKKLAPALHNAYVHWHETQELSQLEDLLPILVEHWQNVALRVLEIFAEQSDNVDKASRDIENMIETRILE